MVTGIEPPQQTSRFLPFLSGDDSGRKIIDIRLIMDVWTSGFRIKQTGY